MSKNQSQLTSTEVAEILGVSERTLHRWNTLRVGPPRCKLGRKVLYRRAALEEWLAANEIKPVRTFSGGVA
jgi:excisionase family DNA binding protein